MGTEAATAITIERPAPPSIVAELAPIVKAARAFEVKDVATNAVALERLRDLRAGEKRIMEYFEPARKAADAAKKEILAARDGLIGPIAAARSIYDQKAMAYEQEERRKAEEEQRRLQAIARKEEEERQLMAAIEAEAEGDTAASEAILAEPVTAPIVQVAPAIAQVTGVATRKIWSSEVHDVRKCFKFLIDRDEWLPLLEKCIPILETGFDPMARAQRHALAIPGVRAVERQAKR